MTLVYDIWSVLAARQRRWVIGAQILSIVMAFSTVIGIASIAPFFSLLGDPKLIDQTGLLHWLYNLGFSSRRSFTVALGLAFLGLVILANLINVIGSFVMIRLALWISTDLQSILFEEYLHRPYIFHARTPSAVLFNNIIHETIRATNQILQNAFSLITNIVTALFIIVSVMLLNPAVAAAMIGALAGGYVLIYLAVRNRLLQAGLTQSKLFVELTKTVNESLGAIKEILVLRTQQYFGAGFARSSEQFARAAAHTQLIAQSPRYVMECVAVVGLVAAALLAGSREQGIGPWLGQLTFLGFAAYRLLPTLQQAFVAIVRIRADRPGFTAIARDLRLARARKDAVAAPDSPWRESPRSDIRLEEVSFRYEPERPPAVDGVSLRIPVRAVIGFVGANGSGKTTLVDLIAGLLVPAQGRIEVDGIVLTEDNRAAWQARIAYVPQNIFLLDTSIAHNVALGVAGADIDQERLLAAAQLAQLDEFVATLPGGYDHVVGERGVKLSGGQRQRLGIARALYADASVLILDEATNALDGLTEQEMMTTIMRLRGRYTIIVIAHRLSTVRACDVIVEFDHGKVTASGTYEGLLRNSETFRRLAHVG
jgi:ATP-binding cassette, subfamily B, bacterial PglK